jgi:hypothetical protein
LKKAASCPAESGECRYLYMLLWLCMTAISAGVMELSAMPSQGVAEGVA